MASPRFGERWGRHWLDLARYADSEGFEFDRVRSIWKYRDWVIDAFNRDYPFDQFTIDQLAGDLVPGARREQIVATGFYCSSVMDVPQGRVVDRVNTTGTVFLGLTIGCAQCHSHKFDPITQREYYQLYAFFNDSADGNREAELEVASPAELARRDAIRSQLAALRKEREAYADVLLGKLEVLEKNLTVADRQELSAQARAVLDIPPKQRSEDERRLLLQAVRDHDAGDRQRQKTISDLEKEEPKIATTPILRQGAERPTHIFIRGEYSRPGAQVFANVPDVLPPLPRVEKPTRLDLAKWLVSPENPLTARVTVNRIWQRYFGLGLVETEHDFGTRGLPPSHPRLLDHLASELAERGWSMKSLHRLIVTSATYRQSSRHRPDLAERDPRNRLLARARRSRLEAELIRDQALWASGLLSERIGGPSVFPYQPAGVMKGRADKSRWTISAGSRVYRRGMYTHYWRLTPHPFLQLFDAPDALNSCSRRTTSNTPPQALTLLNGRDFVEAARHLALRVLREAPPDDDKRIERAFRLCLGRTPNQQEHRLLGDLLERKLKQFSRSEAQARRLIGADVPDSVDAVRLAAWCEVARVLLNLDEFITRG